MHRLLPRRRADYFFVLGAVDYFSMLEAVPARAAADLYTGLAVGHPLGFWLRAG